MRDIKFRGKRVDNGEWVYGDLWQPVRDNQQIAFILRQDNKYEVDPETVGQYIGFNSNKTHHGQGFGVEIYGGDILKCYRDYVTSDENFDPVDGEAIATIEWLGIGWLFLQLTGHEWFFYGPESREFFPECIHQNKNSKEWIKVIGNKWDNPELLTDERDTAGCHTKHTDKS